MCDSALLLLLLLLLLRFRLFRLLGLGALTASCPLSAAAAARPFFSAPVEGLYKRRRRHDPVAAAPLQVAPSVLVDQRDGPLRGPPTVAPGTSTTTTTTVRERHDCDVARLVLRHEQVTLEGRG